MITESLSLVWKNTKFLVLVGKYGHPFPPPVGVWRGLASQPRVEQVSLGSPTR